VASDVCPITPEQILAAVEQVTNVSRDLIMGQRKFKNVVRARHLYWAGLRHYSKMSYPQIGFNCAVHHTTAMEGIRKVPYEVVEALGAYCQQPL